MLPVLALLMAGSKIFYPWWNGVLHFCIYKNFLYLFFSISHYCLEHWLWKKVSHPWVLASWLYINVSFKPWTHVYLPSFEDAVLCCWALQKTELSEMLKCEGEEICLQGKCIRQHFKICLFDGVADSAYFFNLLTLLSV